MKYYQGQELREYEKWLGKKFRLHFLEALNFPEEKMVESAEILKKGFALFNYLKEAKVVERQIQKL